MHYLSIVIDTGSAFAFNCPDLPGFTVHAETRDFEEALAIAREVLTAHLATLVDSGEQIPDSRPLPDLKADTEYSDDFAEALTTVMLPVLLPSGRTRRVNLSLDENTLELMDRSARDRGLTRSAFAAEAARQYAARSDALAAEQDRRAERLKRQRDMEKYDRRRSLSGANAIEERDGKIGGAASEIALRVEEEFREKREVAKRRWHERHSNGPAAAAKQDSDELAPSARVREGPKR